MTMHSIKMNPEAAVAKGRSVYITIGEYQEAKMRLNSINVNDYVKHVNAEGIVVSDTIYTYMQGTKKISASLAPVTTNTAMVKDADIYRVWENLTEDEYTELAATEGFEEKVASGAIVVTPISESKTPYVYHVVYTLSKDEYDSKNNDAFKHKVRICKAGLDIVSSYTVANTSITDKVSKGKLKVTALPVVYKVKEVMTPEEYEQFNVTYAEDIANTPNFIVSNKEVKEADVIVAYDMIYNLTEEQYSTRSQEPAFAEKLQNMTASSLKIVEHAISLGEHASSVEVVAIPSIVKEASIRRIPINLVAATINDPEKGLKLSEEEFALTSEMNDLDQMVADKLIIVDEGQVPPAADPETAAAETSAETPAETTSETTAQEGVQA